MEGLTLKSTVPHFSTFENNLKETKKKCQHGYVQTVGMNTQVDAVSQNAQNAERRKRNTRRHDSMHTICHLEIPTTDLKKSGEFYRKLFGWEIDYGWGPDYAVFNTGEGVLTGGGLDRKDEIAPGNIIIYIQVNDIDEMLDKAEKLGGKKVQEKKEIPNVGWFGLFKDLDGNTLGLFLHKLQAITEL
jgi:predicted enzyme related to lactoylglutathione lyase